MKLPSGNVQFILQNKAWERIKTGDNVYKSLAKKCHEVMRMDRLLEGYHAEQKQTMGLILQQFLLWFKTKKKQK